MNFAWNRMLAAMAALLFGAALAGAADKSQCPGGGDYLAKLQKKPAHLEFVDCKYHGNGEPYWLAEYKVKGVYAVNVENYLVRKFDMKRLKKTCCLWDTPETNYSRDGEHFDIKMASDEDGPAATSTRGDWHKLPFFYVTVAYYKDE